MNLRHVDIRLMNDPVKFLGLLKGCVNKKNNNFEEVCLFAFCFYLFIHS